MRSRLLCWSSACVLALLGGCATPPPTATLPLPTPHRHAHSATHPRTAGCAAGPPGDRRPARRGLSLGTLHALPTTGGHPLSSTALAAWLSWNHGAGRVRRRRVGAPSGPARGRVGPSRDHQYRAGQQILRWPRRRHHPRRHRGRRLWAWWVQRESGHCHCRASRDERQLDYAHRAARRRPRHRPPSRYRRRAPPACDRGE